MFLSSIDANLEFLPPEEILKRQNDLLREHLLFLSEKSPFYKRLFAAHHIDVQAIKSAEDLRSLPFTTKADLEKYSCDFLCEPETEVVDVCITSGTTGEQFAMLQTKEDLERLAYNEEVSLCTAGVVKNDRVLITAAIDRCFMAGLAYFLGLRRIGATVIRGGSSSVPVLTELIRRQRPSVIIGVPTLLLALADRLQGDGDNPACLGVRTIICIGEPVRKQDLSLTVLGEVLKRRWNAEILGTYASTEMATAFPDCEFGAGGHVHPNLIVVEIVDEEGLVVPPGTIGEVVTTPLQVHGMPLLRFKTGDVACLHVEPCKCGRNSWRLGPIIGRKSQAIKYRGTTFYPPAIISVLQEMEGIRGYYLEVYDDYDLCDRVRVVVGAAAGTVEPLSVAEKISERIRIKPEVFVTTPEEIIQKTTDNNKRKPVTFYDYRVCGKTAQE